MNVFEKLGISEQICSGDLCIKSPIDGSILGYVAMDTSQSLQARICAAEAAFLKWRTVPAPVRGELVRRFGEVLRQNKQALGELVTRECGKTLQEGLGEVQEMIDICDFAVGLSRQLYGLTIASERPGHKMLENWHPLGPVGVISAFNFPVAVWAWNAALALVCGDSVIWKPSEKTPLTALACLALFNRVAKEFDAAPDGLVQVVLGDREIGGQMVDDLRLPLISATGSTAMGRAIAPRIAHRFGRSLLELGGNNAIIVAPSADLEMALRAIVFGAVGTAGQRCTTTRRLFLHEDIHGQLLSSLKTAYDNVSVGDPMSPDNLVGPLINQPAYEKMRLTLDFFREQGAVVNGGQRVLEDQYPDACYVKPALVEMPEQLDNVYEETFAPILHVFKYQDLNEAISRQNAVSQGLSSAIFTNDMREAELFTSVTGSDCGIANVNIGTSGAEIGGAFGGEKETGGGRESGSDAWKVYMRRSTATINYSRELPLAQGISFDI
ncbi:MAG: aldehyde dehydrogenase family protein [Gammaproteobacteria bacterium]|nr:aldehyde dehydrogenase family protein [Gammaproteobacteria bacterium]